MEREKTRTNKHGQRQRWVGCLDCGKERWVVILNGQLTCQRCHSCASKRRSFGEKNPSWQGGRVKDPQGYILIKLPPDSPYLSMANSNRYIKEHRLVVSISLNRLLEPKEFVHHKNGNRADNRQENLLIVNSSTHPTSYQYAYQEGYKQGRKDTLRGVIYD